MEKKVVEVADSPSHPASQFSSSCHHGTSIQKQRSMKMYPLGNFVYIFLLTHYAHAGSSTGWTPDDPCAAFEKSTAPLRRLGSGIENGTREAGGADAKLTATLLSDDRSAVVALEGSFRGYVIQARKRDEGGSLVLGEFAAGSDDSARTHSCGGHENVVLSGRGASMKTTASWQAPSNWTDAVVFRALVLREHEGSARYVVVASDPVVIGRVPRVSKLAASLRNAELVPADEEPKTTDSPIMSPGESNVVAQRKSLEKDEENKDSGGGTDNGCGVTKGCFGLPDGCIPQGDCEVMVSYIAEEDGYHFELTGPADKDQMYIATGISETNKMELTSVIECLRMADKTSIRESWNSQGTTNNVMQKTTEGITFGSHGVTDGVLKCTWVRKAVTTVNAVTFDLAKTKYFVLAAKGQLVPPDSNTIPLFLPSF